MKISSKVNLFQYCRLAIKLIDQILLQECHNNEDATKGDNLLAICWVYEEPKFYRNGNSVGRINFRIFKETDGLKEKFISEIPKAQNVYKYLAFEKIEGFEKLGVQMTYK